MLTETVRMLLRRWLLCVLVLVLTVLAGVATFMVIKPVQESKAEVLFVPSVTQPGVNGPTNPLLNLGGSLAIVPTVVQVKTSDQSVASRLYSQGFTATYKIVPNLAENAGPTLLVSADSKSRDVAQKTLVAVLDEINNQLAQVQSSQNTNSKLLISTVTLTQSTHPEPVRKGQVQKAIIAAIAVLIIGLLLVLLLERQRPTPAKVRTEAPPEKKTPRRAKTSAPESERPQTMPQGGDRRVAQRRKADRAGSGRRTDEPDQTGQPDRPGPQRSGRRGNRPEPPSDSSILPGGMPENSPDPANR